MWDFNIATPTHTLAMPLFQPKRSPSVHNMTTSTKIEIGYCKLNRMTDVSDLAELLFPGNRSHQHAFLVICFTLKWADPRIVPNLAESAREHGISRRTFERVRAKTRRMGLIERGIYMPCSQFEALFVSTAHTEADIDATVAAAQEAMANVG